LEKYSEEDTSTRELPPLQFALKNRQYVPLGTLNYNMMVVLKVLCGVMKEKLKKMV
jgi:hypothetical protein